MSTEYRDTVGESGDADSVDIGAVAPGTVPAAGAEPGRKKRGRPPGSGNRSAAGASPAKNQKVALDLSSITGLLVGVHVMLAQATKTPELAITMDEGTNMLRSAQNVMRHYNVQSTQKTLDWISLFGVCSYVYVPRMIAIAANKKARTIQQPQNFPHKEVSVTVVGDAPPGAEELFSMNNTAHPEGDGF